MARYPSRSRSINMRQAKLIAAAFDHAIRTDCRVNYHLVIHWRLTPYDDTPFKALQMVLEAMRKWFARRGIREAFVWVRERERESVSEHVQGFNPGTDMTKFRSKVRQFVEANRDHIAIIKLRRNEPLTLMDMSELERMFVQAGLVDSGVMETLRAEGGLGIFVRSLVGLDREAAKKAFAEFIAGKNLTADQIEFVDMIIEHLTERGVMPPSLLYESPFTDLNPLGVKGLFGDDGAAEVISILDDVRRRAAA